MRGDDVVRRCFACDLNVYNIADLTSDEAEKVITFKEGKLCSQLWRRQDGTVTTASCLDAYRQSELRADNRQAELRAADRVRDYCFGLLFTAAIGTVLFSIVLGHHGEMNQPGPPQSFSTVVSQLNELNARTSKPKPPGY